MDNLYDVFRTITLVALVLNGIKSMTIGHFPWEKCECCGKPWKEHKDNFQQESTKEERTRNWLMQTLDDHRVLIQYPESGKHSCKWLCIGQFDVTYAPDILRYEVFLYRNDGENTIRDYIGSDITSIGTAEFLWKNVWEDKNEPNNPSTS